MTDLSLKMVMQLVLQIFPINKSNTGGRLEKPWVFVAYFVKILIFIFIVEMDVMMSLFRMITLMAVLLD